MHAHDHNHVSTILSNCFIQWPFAAVVDVCCFLCDPVQVASEQLATAQQEGLAADELSTIRVFQVRLLAWHLHSH
jgi:hypothetical protein